MPWQAEHSHKFELHKLKVCRKMGKIIAQDVSELNHMWILSFTIGQKFHEEIAMRVTIETTQHK